MDRRVKERLVGASILVVLVVLIVPELLSGPKQAVNATGGASELHNVVVDMTTKKATPAADDPTVTSTDTSTTDSTNPANAAGGAGVAGAAGITDVPEAAAAGEHITAEGTGTRAQSEGVPGAASAPMSIVTLQAQTPAKAPLENEPTPPKSSSPSQSVETSHHNWSVQVGSFASRDNAEKLQRSLKTDGFSASISPRGTGKAMRYRVRVGPAADRAGAEKLIVRLRKEGHAASVVAP